MTSDPARAADLLADDLRNWCSANLGFDGTDFVCIDGTAFENTRQALQLAMSAHAYDFTIQLLERSGLITHVCPRCTQRMPMKEIIRPKNYSPHRIWWHLCSDCARKLVILSANERELQALVVAGAE